MSTLYLIVYNFFSQIMQNASELSPAVELVSICVTLLITYFIVLYPLKLVIDLIFRRKAK